jgi:hypothetical protein
MSWVFLRLFGAIYVAAFASLGVQVIGLVGQGGILPAGEYFAAAREGWGEAVYWRLPTLFWLHSGDVADSSGDWHRVGATRCLGAMGSDGSYRGLLAVSLFRLRRAGLHEFSVGPIVARSRIPRDLSDRGIAHRHYFRFYPKPATSAGHFRAQASGIRCPHSLSAIVQSSPVPGSTRSDSLVVYSVVPILHNPARVSTDPFRGVK